MLLFVTEKCFMCLSISVFILSIMYINFIIIVLFSFTFIFHNESNRLFKNVFVSDHSAEIKDR